MLWLERVFFLSQQCRLMRGVEQLEETLLYVVMQERELIIVLYSSTHGFQDCHNHCHPVTGFISYLLMHNKSISLNKSLIFIISKFL